MRPGGSPSRRTRNRGTVIQKVRSKVNVVMNRLVREGVITGFKTNFDFPDGTHTPQVAVALSEEWSLEAARLLVVDALAEVVIGIDVTVARDRP
jgi:hypothetical protein